MINYIGMARQTYNARGSGYTNPLADDMSTKGQCRMSEDRLIAKIKELAYRDAAAGKNSQEAVKFHGVGFGSPEWRKLRADYISFASPDREGIIKKKLAQLSGNSRSVSLNKNGHIEALEILFKKDRKSAHRRADPDVGGNYISFKDQNGREIAHYCTLNGWSFFDTPAESARRSEFYDLWKEALAEAQESLGAETAGDGIIFQARA